MAFKDVLNALGHWLQSPGFAGLCLVMAAYIWVKGQRRPNAPHPRRTTDPVPPPPMSTWRTTTTTKPDPSEVSPDEARAIVKAYSARLTPQQHRAIADALREETPAQ